MIFVLEDGLQLERTGGGVDLVVRGQQLAAGDLGLARAVVSVHHQPSTREQLLQHGRQIVLGNREQRGDRLHLRDHHEPVLVAGVDDVPRIDEAQADAATDRSRDSAVDELQLGVGDGPLVAFYGALELTDHRGLIVVLLPRDEALGDQIVVTLEIDPRVLELRRIAGELPLGLNQLGVE